MIKGICQDCGRKGVVHIHHKDGNHGNEEPDNRRILCPRCHMVAHGRADQGTGERSEHLPVNEPFPSIEWAEVRRQYFKCFPRAY